MLIRTQSTFKYFVNLCSFLKLSQIEMNLVKITPDMKGLDASIGNYLEEKCQSESNQQLSLRYHTNVSNIPKLFSKVIIRLLTPWFNPYGMFLRHMYLCDYSELGEPVSVLIVVGWAQIASLRGWDRGPRARCGTVDGFDWLAPARGILVGFQWCTVVVLMK